MINLPKNSPTAFCQDSHLTFATVIDTAWALTPLKHTISSNLAIESMSLGRDASSIPRISDIIGPFIRGVSHDCRLVAFTEALLLMRANIRGSRLLNLRLFSCLDIGTFRIDEKF